MGLFRRLAGILGIGKDEAEELKDEEKNDIASNTASASASASESASAVPAPNLPRKGFSVPVHVSVDRTPPGPVLVPCISGDGGVQGFRWFAKRLRIDEDGDVADEFLDEISVVDKSVSIQEPQRPLPRFEVKYSTRPVKVRNKVRSADGKIQLNIEFQGRLEWV